MKFTDFEKFHTKNFDSFCKKIIRNECVEAHREINQKLAKEFFATEELLLSQLITHDVYHFGYVAIPVGTESFAVEDPDLAQALFILPYVYKKIIYQSFFLEMDDELLAIEYGIKINSVQAKRSLALKKLKQILEEISDE